MKLLLVIALLTMTFSVKSNTETCHPPFFECEQTSKVQNNIDPLPPFFLFRTSRNQTHFLDLLDSNTSRLNSFERAKVIKDFLRGEGNQIIKNNNSSTNVDKNHSYVKKILLPPVRDVLYEKTTILKIHLYQRFLDIRFGSYLGKLLLLGIETRRQELGNKYFSDFFAAMSSYSVNNNLIYKNFFQELSSAQFSPNKAHSELLLLTSQLEKNNFQTFSEAYLLADKLMLTSSGAYKNLKNNTSSDIAQLAGSGPYEEYRIIKNRFNRCLDGCVRSGILANLSSLVALNAFPALLDEYLKRNDPTFVRTLENPVVAS